MSARPDNVVTLPDAFYPPLIPEGEYLLTMRRHKLVKRFDRDVLELWCTVIDGEHFGKQIARYYPVQASSKRRSFTARPGSDFVREYALLFGQRPRFNAAPLDAFQGRSIAGRVETVRRDHRQKALPKALFYSTIRELIRGEGG